VRVLSVGRKFVKIQREDPVTGKVIARKGKALISEMVYRDPKKRGKDRPTSPPATVFSEQRKRELKVLEPTPAPDPEPTPAPPRSAKEEAECRVCLEALLAALDDDSTDDDW
jgi:hypothetical protein